MDPVSTVALGIELHLVPTAEGGRRSPLLGGSEPGVRFTYRPNWGLPGWPDGDQTAAPVLGFSRVDIRPGDNVRAVIVPLFPVEVPTWRGVVAGDELKMYEGSRICGRGYVVWVEEATWPMPEDEAERFVRWLADSSQ
ncbi:hypothetical protein [Oerskovia paurometabola]|uniref:hypothetical protein n=1 Tax=Oerskovia paurometabola TaxID=162170 RepID=UPI00343E28A8